MKNKLLLPILALLVVAIFVLWKAGGGAGETTPEEVSVLAPGQGPSSGPSSSDGATLPDLMIPEREEVAREEVEEDEEESAVASSPREAPTSNAVWVKGRVIFPDRMPNDMGEITVTARGRRFSDKGDARREHTVAIERDGAFRVAFSKETKRGWLDVNGRYLYMPEKLKVEMSELPDEILLEPEMGGVITGTTRAPLGEQWTEESRDGAHVQVNSWRGGDRVSRTARVEADGSFVVSGVPPGNEYNLQMELPFWCNVRMGDIEVRSGEVTDVALQVSAGSSIRGQVVDAEGVGRPEVHVELSGVPTDGSWLHATTRTDDEGFFQFRGVKDAEVTVKAVLDEHLPVEADLGLVPEGSTRTGVLLTIDEGNYIAGIVQWPDGTPAANAWISVSQDREVEGARFVFDDASSEKSEADGTFKITGLESSVCVVRASAKSFRQKELDKAKERAKEGRDYTLRPRGPTYKIRVDDVQPGTTGLVLTLEKGDSLAGKVTDDEGTGLTSFVVSAEPVGGPDTNLESEDSINRVVVSLDGSFSVDGLQDGDWRIRAKAKGHALSEAVVVTSPGAGEVELICPRFVEIAGVVSSPSGEPVSGARVWVENLDEGEEFELEKIGRSWGEDATTNQRGEFTARDVRPGRVRLSAGADGFGTSQGVLVQAAPGAETEGVSLRLRRAARIRGQLHASVGNLEGRDIQVRAESGGSYWNNEKTDSNGRFELDDLDAGSYRLTLEKEDGESAQARISSQRTVAVVVDVEAGEDVTVVLGGPPANPTTVSGRVLSGGQPLGGVVVSCRAQDGGDFDNDATETNTEGEYALTVAGEGGYRFQVGNPNAGLTTYHRDLVKGANPGTDFTLSTGRISGTVSGKDGGPKKGCDVTLVVIELEEAATASSSRSVNTDELGNYHFDFVEPGTYYLRVSDDRDWWRTRGRAGEGTELREGLKVAKGAALENVNFALQEEGKVEGHVTGVDGLPANRARIRVSTLSGHAVHTRRSSHTNRQGNYDYERLAPGRYLIRAELDGAKTEEREIRVQAGSVAQMDLTFE